MCETTVRPLAHGNIADVRNIRAAKTIIIMASPWVYVCGNSDEDSLAG